LILDCLFIEKNFSHLNISEAKDEVRKIRPKKKTLFVGTLPFPLFFPFSSLLS
jgi:hypothetical protein